MYDAKQESVHEMSDEPQPRQPNQGGTGPTEPPAAAEEKQTPPQRGAEPKEPMKPEPPAAAEQAKQPEQAKTEQQRPGAGEKKIAPQRPAAEDTETRQLTAVTVPNARPPAATGNRQNTAGNPQDGQNPQDRQGAQNTPNTQGAQHTQNTPNTQDPQDTQTRQLAAIRVPKAAAPAPASAPAPPPAPIPAPRAEPPAAGAATVETAEPVETKGGEKKMKRPKRTGWRRILPTWRMLLGTFVIGVLLLIGLFFLGYSMVKIPAANAFATKQSNVYLYADGSQLARDGEVNRENVTLAQVSKDAQHAVLAAEDRDFYTESAVDPKAMLRAAWNTATGKGTQSGSTITQQYVKNYYLAQEQTVTRKVKEVFVAIKLDRSESKDQILEGYLNTSYFGRNAYGIQAAAQAYYGKDATDLDPARAAYLAALVNAPSEYDVVAHPENKAAAVARWNYVLDGMVKKGWLGESERAAMKFPMPKEQTASTGMSGQRGYIVNAVNDYLIKNKIVDSDSLAAGGYRITTTLQKSRQNAFVKAVDDKLMSKLDKKNKVDNYVRAGGASVDPKTGQVVAMYGGIDYVKQYTNGATRGDFQVGSTFKPFVFASAVDNGSTTQSGQTITPNTYYDGTDKRAVQGWPGGTYAPENEDGKSYGQITVRKATDLSVNSVYAQMSVDVGPSKIKQTAVGLGIPADTKDLQPYPSIALGTATASVLDMAEAYATLANHGKHGTYTMVEKITRDGTQDIKLPESTTKQAVSRQAADTTTSVLQSVVDNGTATAAQAAGRPAAGKTGTAEEDTAAWFAGYTPDLATVVSVMGQDPVTAAHKPLYGALGLPRINGGGAPTEIWAQYTKAALQGTKASDFDLDLQAGAEIVAPPTQSTGTPGTGGQANGGTTGPNQDNGGTTTGGQNTGGTPGTTTNGTTAGGTTGGSTTAGTTTSGTTTAGTDSGTTTSGTDSGTSTGTTTGGTSTGTTAGTDTGTTTGTTAGGPGGFGFVQ
ncbi:transglycosylase domain-containing protein [Streptomyces shenzhenensis]|uniref:transglycosylase domain-containing protein n=1 Tax=Streptomyces shenzhenensis TaxID=943815 RepID=UPI003D9BFF04